MAISLADPTGYYSSLAQDPDLGELVELFVAEMPAKMTAFQAAAACQNWATLRTLAHQLKGAAGSYGFGKLTLFAQELEAAVQEPTPETAVLGPLQQLLAACQRVRPGSAAL